VKPLAGAERSEEFYLRFSKWSTVFRYAALVFVTYLSREVAFVLNAAFSLRGLTSGALLGGLLLAVFWRGGRARPLVVGMLTSLMVMILIRVLPLLGWIKTEIFWPWYTLIGTVVTLLTAFAVRGLAAGEPSVP